jgi:hypothetical protein
MSCDDPECPGCLADKFVNTMKEQGADADMVITLFFASLSEAFSGAHIELVRVETAEGTIH